LSSLNLRVLHGPNMNLLGQRQTELYGTTGLIDIDAELCELAQRAGHTLRCSQHNGEGALVEAVQQMVPCGDHGLLINPAAYTHTSVALRDALLAVGRPVWEVHITDPAEREPFRQVNLIQDLCVGRTVGRGAAGYAEGLRGLIEALGG
jgi:3-dehydroquinate dehydratase-2